MPGPLQFGAFFVDSEDMKTPPTTKQLEARAALTPLERLTAGTRDTVKAYQERIDHLRGERARLEHLPRSWSVEQQIHNHISAINRAIEARDQAYAELTYLQSLR